VGTDLTRIGEKARKEPGLVFTSLYHHIYDVDNLRACYDTLEAKKATGVDGVTKEEYGKKLEENLRDLSGRLKRMGYRPEPKRRSYIPKAGSEKGRPLGISNLEDKIVEEATQRTLEPIYEAVERRHTEGLTEEPDVWESRLSGSGEGQEINRDREEILWHHRESRW
jgi:RNA-directed DNA polymerase